jgi:hypothetical protein
MSAVQDTTFPTGDKAVFVARENKRPRESENLGEMGLARTLALPSLTATVKWFKVRQSF